MVGGYSFPDHCVFMARRGGHYRSLALAACLPYVAWCALGHWLHGLSGCCDAGAPVHCAAEHHCGHEHFHSSGHRDHKTPFDIASPLVAAVHGSVPTAACPFCDFVCQAQTSATVQTPSFELAFSGLIRPPAPLRFAFNLARDHSARGPPIG